MKNNKKQNLFKYIKDTTGLSGFKNAIIFYYRTQQNYNAQQCSFEENRY